MMAIIGNAMNVAVQHMHGPIRDNEEPGERDQDLISILNLKWGCETSLLMKVKEGK